MANDFSGDSQCIVLYRFEGDPVRFDSKGTEDLTLSTSPPAASGAQVKEGSFSALFTTAVPQYGYRTDANLGASVPLKSGTSNKTISACAWVRMAALPTGGAALGILARDGAKTTWSCFTYDTGAGTKATFLLGDTLGAFSQLVSHATSLNATTWYHLTFGYRDSDKAYRIFVRDGTAGDPLGSDITGTATNNIGLFADTDMMLGSYGTGAVPLGSYYDGYLDEVVIFSKLLTATDATNIAKGLYTGTGDQSESTVGQMWLK